MNKIVKDFRGRDRFNQTMKQLAGAGIKVGIFDNERIDGHLSNAELLFILENGSIQHNMPPRPVVEPGINKVKDEITDELKNAALAIVKGSTNVTPFLNKAGQIAVTSIKGMFGSDELARNAPSTIKVKGFNSPLIEEGKLRDAISYSVSYKEKIFKPELKKEDVGKIEVTDEVTEINELAPKALLGEAIETVVLL